MNNHLPFWAVFSVKNIAKQKKTKKLVKFGSSVTLDYNETFDVIDVSQDVHHIIKDRSAKSQGTLQRCSLNENE